VAAESGCRPLLFSVAYGMTGSVGDAEDIVQDAFVGLTRARQAGTMITDPKAYLTTAVTRLGINHLRSARVRRETYVGDWLPEPVVVPVGLPGPAEHAELADSLSMAFLVLLEILSPTERAVFMLREAFGYGYADVARVTGKTEQNCRQIFARARHRIAAGGQASGAAPPLARRPEGEELARRFFEAAAGGDMDALLGMLAPDVVFHGDGGGKAQALGRPLAGRERVVRLLLGLFRRGQVLGASLRLAWVNGQPGAVVYDAEERVVTVFVLDVATGVVQAIRSVVNPDKLGHLGPVSDLARLGTRVVRAAGAAAEDRLFMLAVGLTVPPDRTDAELRAQPRSRQQEVVDAQVAGHAPGGHQQHAEEDEDPVRPGRAAGDVHDVERHAARGGGSGQAAEEQADADRELAERDDAAEQLGVRVDAVEEVQVPAVGDLGVPVGLGAVVVGAVGAGDEALQAGGVGEPVAVAGGCQLSPAGRDPLPAQPQSRNEPEDARLARAE
jgi:RNA polymerase sigma factor (sigma-70 family)